ncbi:tetratricopeptide repeat-containing diguanylate cyclase [Shewanella woodyi]|uniref:tetratricopeptide repeat-containing diguanylate cyclase n=1 Tax=Shewanella woodyi TaxID=60961 RepID=UPI0007EB948A|nr:tetratricopeptide repeat-containing diguanylate cyclase [Shewanella woodyi]
MPNIVLKNSMTFDISFRYSMRLKPGEFVRQYWPLLVAFLGRNLHKLFNFSLIVWVVCPASVMADYSTHTAHHNSQINRETIDESLSSLELIRSQSPEVVSNQLLTLSPKFDVMNREQQYRFTLLQSHSYALSGDYLGASGPLITQLAKPFSEKNAKYRIRMMTLLTNIYSHFDYYADALKTLHQLLPLLADVDDIEGKVHGYIVAAGIFGKIELHEEALKYSGELFSKIDKMKSARNQCFALYSYVDSIHVAYGDDEARFLQIQSLYGDLYRYCAIANEKMIMSSSLLGQAKVLFYSKDFDNAREKIDKAIKLSTEIPYLLDVALAYILLSEVESAENNNKLALTYINQALELALKVKEETQITKAYKLLSKFNEKLGMTDKALVHLKLHQQYREKILDRNHNAVIAFETTKLDYLEKEHQIHYLNKDRELYTAKAELAESQRNNERMMLILICGCLVVLTLFAINMTLQKRKYMRLAQFDVLTGIFNRGTGQNLAENRYIKDSMSGTDFSVILFDLDDFKRVNNNYGHAMGDWVLKKVCEVVNKECRSSDIFTRFGGEEFAIFMPNTSESVAREVAEKCKARVLAIDTRYSGHEFTISARFGISTSTEKDLSLDPILQRADIAMYQSKQQARERVSVYTPE